MASLDIVRGFPEGERERIVSLLRAYEAGLGISLCFQDFDGEVAGLPGAYAPPRGSFAVARLDGRLVGVVGLRPVDGLDGAAEMKRLYVDPGARGSGAGRALACFTLDEARRLGYVRVVLDTLPSMLEAQELYRRLGFCEIDPYYDNPVPGALFMERRLEETTP